MAPATLRHNDIVWNLRGALRDKLPAGTGCRPYGPQQPIETVDGALGKPDVFVACSTQPGGALTIASPVVVFEVLSPGKENWETDEMTKVDGVFLKSAVEFDGAGGRLLSGATGPARSRLRCCGTNPGSSANPSTVGGGHRPPDGEQRSRPAAAMQPIDPIPTAARCPPSLCSGQTPHTMPPASDAPAATAEMRSENPDTPARRPP